MTPLKFYVNETGVWCEEDFQPDESCIDGYMKVIVDIDHPLLDPDLLYDELEDYWDNIQLNDQPYIIRHY